MKFYKLLSVLLCITFLLSCDEEEEAQLLEQNYIAFNPAVSVTVQVNEASEEGYTLEITQTEQRNSETVVQLEFNDLNDNLELGEDYTLSSENVIIEAGSYSGSITISPINDDMFNSDLPRELEVRIVDNNAGYMNGIADEGSFRKVITIIDDDCETDLSSTYSSEVKVGSSEAPSHTATLTPVDGSDNQYNIDSAWGPKFVSWATGDNSFDNRFVYSGILTLQDDGSVSIESNIGNGTGSYDSCGDVFNLTLSQEVFSDSFQVNVVLNGNDD